MAGDYMFYIKKSVMRCLLYFCIIIPAVSASVVDLVIDVDIYDDLVKPKYADSDLYGTNQIAQFFRNCKENGVSAVFWRTQCQIASYRSKLNYNISEELAIRSHPDNRRHTGSFSARVGVHFAKDGIFQDLALTKNKTYTMGAWISVLNDNEAYLRVEDVKTGEVIAQSYPVLNTGADFKFVELSFVAPGPVRVGVYGADSNDINVFVVDDISLRDVTGKNLIRNGDMEQINALEPADWQITSNCNFLVLNGDANTMSKECIKINSFPENILKRMRARGSLKKHILWKQAFASEKGFKYIDPLSAAVREAHKNGIRIYAWVDPLDDGRRSLPGYGVWFTSRFHEDNPQYRLLDKDGHRRWGQLCFGYPAVREYKSNIIRELLDYGVDGIYLKTGFQHNMIWDFLSHDYEDYVYNDIALKEYNRRWGHPVENKYDNSHLKEIYGDYFIEWIREASEIIHNRGKQLVFSIRPGDYLEGSAGKWPNNWRKLVDEKVIDMFLLEPRLNTRHHDFLQMLEKRYGYFNLCHKAGIKVGVDFYLNALAENRMRPKSLGAEPHKYFVSEVETLMQEPLGFIGIYESMYVNGRNYWPDIKVVSSFIPASDMRKKNEKMDKTQDIAENNIALALKGSRAVVNINGKKSNAGAVIDGELTESSSIHLQGTPFEVTITLPYPAVIDSVNIYPGQVSHAGNPSGECGISAYRIEGMINGKWQSLGISVTNAPTVQEEKSMSGYDFVYKHKLSPPVKIEKFRLVVIKSSDTGRRISCPHNPCVPEDNRVTYIREIELLTR